MSVEQRQREVNNYDKEIASLEQKKAKIDSDIASLQGKILSLQKSITKSTPISTVTAKYKQIENFNSQIGKKATESSELGKKIADKRTRRNDVYLKLQKEQQTENKKKETANQQLMLTYQRRIEDLQQQLVQGIIPKRSNFQTDTVSASYDVFVSHASEDKESFVDEFVEELEKQGLSVWYDTKKIKWGDSLREKIDEGLSNARFGVVVLSPSYIDEKKYWTKAELDALFQVESINGKTILPIWHNLTKKQVEAYSPIIAGRKAMTTASMTPEEIAIQLKELFKPNDMED